MSTGGNSDSFGTPTPQVIIWICFFLSSLFLRQYIYGLSVLWFKKTSLVRSVWRTYLKYKGFFKGSYIDEYKFLPRARTLRTQWSSSTTPCYRRGGIRPGRLDAHGELIHHHPQWIPHPHYYCPKIRIPNFGTRPERLDAPGDLFILILISLKLKQQSRGPHWHCLGSNVVEEWCINWNSALWSVGESSAKNGRVL